MKLLFYSSYYHPYLSGVTAYTEQLIDHFKKSHAVTVLTFPHKKNLPRTEKYKEVDVVRMPYVLKISKGFLSPQSIFIFLKYAILSDVVFITIPNFEALLLVVFARLFGKKVIGLYYCTVFLGNDILSRIIMFFLHTSIHIQINLAHSIVTFPEYSIDAYISSKKKQKIVKTLPPIKELPSDENIYKKYRKMKNNEVWIGFVGRMAREKGVEYLIDAIANMKSTKRIRLIVVGPTEVVGELKYYKKVMGRLKKIDYLTLGKLTEEELGTFYRIIDMLVLPSINSTEAFGMVQAEAMMKGTPVVASNLPGVRVPISYTGMGVLVEPKSSLALENAMNDIIKNRNLYANEAIMAKAKEIFADKKVFKFYDKLLASYNR